MKPFILLALCASVLAVCTLPPARAAAPAAAPAAAVPIEHFFDNPAFSSAVLSPDARSLAVLVGGKETRDRLAVIDLADNSIKVVGHFKNMDVGSFDWVNNERLVFDLNDKRVGPGDRDSAPGLYAVNRDGTAFRQLASHTENMYVEQRNASVLLPWHTRLLKQVGKQDSEYVYVITHELSHSTPHQVKHVNLLRLNTLTGDSEEVKRPGATQSWLLDHRGEPRLATVLENQLMSVLYNDPATKTWRKLTSFDAYVGGKGFMPVAFAPDGTLYVSTSVDSDKQALHRYDLGSGTIDRKPVLKLTLFDFQGKLVTNSNKLLGVEYLGDAKSTVWFDPALKAVQDRIDALLPSTANLLGVAARAETPWVLVTSYSDVQPAQISLFNTVTGKFNRVGEFHPLIKAAQMATQELVHYKARDGLEIPAWLTVPAGSTRKDFPLVVMVHGGPYVRGKEWGWNADVQFLASRGYAVLEPEFRGSTGYGHKHFRAGWKQWGRAMQDDIADGTRWAIAQGIADPKRICIAGASYGGYATLMGLLNDPDLYKCGINWVGVTDIDLLFTGHWTFDSDISQGWKQYGMPVLVGDPVADAVQFEQTSPLKQAARIRQPLLLAYGGADRRVPSYHGRKFYKAVKSTNPDVEWVLYDEEGHGWSLPRNRIDFWGRVEKFLGRHIGKP